ncbi:hypothetical protein IFM89_026404 [Coptis chinensis]|uniref:ATPase family AAA domain-containing protein n=1 Tax=Coptis chinensis TaxID=261450 RepID=A0A835LRL0_9MAGN|nr:hypothetical protein IFM89_026404 [Coptis chinensis]
MAASALKKASYAAITVAATSYSVLHNRAYADNSPTVEPQPTMSGLDADSLERAAKASRNINNSRLKKQIFEVMNLQEATRLAELDFEKAQYREHQAEQDITEHETQRSQNAEFVKMQELSSERTEKARRTSEEQIQAQKPSRRK